MERLLDLLRSRERMAIGDVTWSRRIAGSGFLGPVQRLATDLQRHERDLATAQGIDSLANPADENTAGLRKMATTSA